MTWIVEQPLTILLLLVTAEAVLFAAMVQTGRKFFMPIMAVVAVFGFLLLALEWAVVTQREEVEATLYQVADALERNDANEVIAHLDTGAAESISQARHYMGILKIGEVKIKRNLNIVIPPNGNDKLATATFNVTVVVSDNSPSFANQHVPRFLKVFFRQVGDRWKIYDYEDFDPRKGL